MVSFPFAPPPATLLLAVCVSLCGPAFTQGSDARPPAEKTEATPSLAAPAAPVAVDPVQALQLRFAAIAKASRPGIVTLRAYRRGVLTPEEAAAISTEEGDEGWDETPFSDEYQGFRLVRATSGFVVSKSGEILTCHHPLVDSTGKLVDLIEIEYADGTRALGELVGAEPTVNLAIVRGTIFPEGREPEFSVLKFGDSNAMQPGYWCFGVGDPKGPERFFAAGTFINRPSRDCYQEMISAFYLQAAMVVPPEAYGGPLLNLAGEVVGMLSPSKPSPGFAAQTPRFGIEYALPSKIIGGLYESIRKTGSTRSPWLGFSVMSRAELAAERGVAAFELMPKPRHGIYIERLFTPSPAQQAGIQVGDFLVAFDGQGVFQPVDFQRYLYLSGIGHATTLKVWRAGQLLELKVTIEERPAAARPR